MLLLFANCVSCIYTPLKLRPCGAIQIRLLLLLWFWQPCVFMLNLITSSGIVCPSIMPVPIMLYLVYVRIWPEVCRLWQFMQWLLLWQKNLAYSRQQYAAPIALLAVLQPHCYAILLCEIVTKFNFTTSYLVMSYKSHDTVQCLMKSLFVLVASKYQTEICRLLTALYSDDSVFVLSLV